MTPIDRAPRNSQRLCCRTERYAHTASAMAASGCLIAHHLPFGVLTKHSLSRLAECKVLILSNVNYVKKVVFPLEILPVIAMGAAVFHGLISLGVLLAAFALFNGYLHWTVVFTPLVVLPLVILTVGIAWMLASLGTFLRDVGQTIGIITTVLMFLAPVFYPVTAVPEEFRPWLMANPLTFIIEQAREVLIWGHVPDWTGLGTYTVVAMAITWAGYAWFQKTRKGFADVL